MIFCFVLTRAMKAIIISVQANETWPPCSLCIYCSARPTHVRWAMVRFIPALFRSFNYHGVRSYLFMATTGSTGAKTQPGPKPLLFNVLKIQTGFYHCSSTCAHKSENWCDAQRHKVDVRVSSVRRHVIYLLLLSLFSLACWLPRSLFSCFPFGRFGPSRIHIIICLCVFS